jgi:hypothetical protein
MSASSSITGIQMLVRAASGSSRNASAKPSQSGFYQVEILVGVSILLLVMAIVAAYYRSNVLAARKSDAYFISSQIASAALEDAKSDMANADSLKALLDAVGSGTFTKSMSVTRSGRAFDLSVKFRKVSAGSNLMRIKAYVKWDGNLHGNALGTVYPYAP